MALSGPAYERSSRSSATEDGGGDGRWVAVDESGWDGEQLVGRSDQFLSIGSVAIDDNGAAVIVDELRRQGHLAQPPELKFGQFSRTPSRVSLLSQLLGPGGDLEGRARVYLVDKHFFATAKIIDVFLEEEAHERGENLYEGDRARRYARTLYLQGPRALGNEEFSRLISTVVGFCSGRNREGAEVSADALFSEFRRAFARSHRRDVSDILQQLLRTREHVDAYPHDLVSIPELEPLIPCLQVIARSWSERLGACSLIVDEQGVFTDEVLDSLSLSSTFDITPSGPGMGVRRRAQSRAVQSILRGVSHEHPSIQLADLVAGAGQAVARRYAGQPSPAGEDLYPAVVPLILMGSMIPFDDTAVFSGIA